MVRTALFMNEDGNAFSACMTCEEELGRVLVTEKASRSSHPRS